jgi:hypothetical protein
MKQIKIRPLLVFNTPEGVFDNLNNSSTGIDDFTKNKYKPENYHFGIAPLKSGRSTYVIPFKTGELLQFGICPDPIQIYFASAYNYFLSAEDYKSQFSIKFNNVPNSLIYPFIQNKFSSIILLHTALEAFINSVIPDSITYSKEVKENNAKLTKELTKEQIERLGFSEKYKDVIKKVSRIDFFQTNQKAYDIILEFTNLRNDIVHLKTISEGNKNHYFKVYNEAIHCDLNKYFESVKEYMNCFKANYIE